MRYLFPTGKGYQRKWLGQDVLSGVVIAAVSIPISMGYAQIAGLPAVYGLYGSLLPVILFARLSTSPQFIFGVDAAPAAMIGGVLGGMGIAMGSAEAERVLPVLDCAILVISGTDGVQSHSRTLWQLLSRHRIPTFLFLNKMDLHALGREVLLSQLRSELSEGCVDMADPELSERAAECDEDALEEYLATGEVSQSTLRRLLRQRKLFPCYFGSALKLEGVRELLAGLDQFTEQPAHPSGFSARVYKIARDPQGNRLTFLKVTGGELRVRTVLQGERDAP